MPKMYLISKLVGYADVENGPEFDSCAMHPLFIGRTLEKVLPFLESIGENIKWCQIRKKRVKYSDLIGKTDWLYYTGLKFDPKWNGWVIEYPETLTN